MKRISLIGRERYFLNVLIVMQGILIALLTIFLLNQQYMETWRKYPQQNGNTIIYLKNIAEEKNLKVDEFLYETSMKNKMFIVRRDMLLENDGTFKGYRFGICGDISDCTPELTFLNQKIIDKNKIEKLLSSDEIESTIGMDQGSIYMVADIPRFRFGEKVIVKQLSQTIRESNTVNGTYIVCGLSGVEEKEKFLTDLENITGLTQDRLLIPLKGENVDNSFAEHILEIFLLIQVMLNIVVFLVISVQSLGKQGKLVLLGWSKSVLVCKIFGNYILFSIIYAPFLVVIGYFLSGWKPISQMLISHFFLAALGNILLTVLEIAIATSVIFMTTSIDAICGRLPKKVLYVLGILGYFLLSAALVFCGSYVDQPIQYISENAKIAEQWKDVSDYMVLNKISIGEDTDTFTGRSNQLNEDIYNWYSDMANEEGVYIVNTTYYSDDTLNLWNKSKIFKEIPKNAFWYFAMSPNYLEKLGVQVSEEVVREAENGVRVYLLPESMTEEEQMRIKGWIEENTVKSISEGDIPTEFTKKPQFDYITYKSYTDFFTWNTSSKFEATEKNPVIYIGTPQNMRYFETESLKANGFNGYIKFRDEKAMCKYTNKDLMSKYNLSDNEIVFTEVKSYIDGIQKELMLTLSWFGLVFLVLLVILTGILLTLATIFRIANQERINVKKFLGFSFWQIYRMPFLFIAGMSVAEIIVMLILHSKFGILLMLVAFVIQLLVFAKYMSQDELKRVLLAFKGD